MVLDPIGQLQALLDHRAKSLESIIASCSAPGSLRSSSAQSPADAPIPAPRVAPPATIVDNSVYGRLLRAAHDMQIQIESRIRPVVRDLLESKVTVLRDQADQSQNALKDCLTQVDQSILNCFSQMDEYHRLRSELTALNQRLADLGATPDSFTLTFDSDDAIAGIMTRLEGLRADEKI